MKSFSYSNIQSNDCFVLSGSKQFSKFRNCKSWERQRIRPQGVILFVGFLMNPQSISTGQIITITLNGGLVRESPQKYPYFRFRNYTNLPRYQMWKTVEKKISPPWVRDDTGKKNYAPWKKHSRSREKIFTAPGKEI